MKNTGTLGSSLAALLGLTCPVCWPAAGAFLASIGLGFAVSLTVILPLLFFLLGLAWWGMYSSYKNNHHHIEPLVISIIAGLLIPAGRYIIGNLPVTYMAIGAFITAAIWNYSLLRKCKK
jgi:O-antigen/teichoic acid export membrane protein